jgi:ABC-type Fe3+-siderophore transport system permease subunit
MIVVAWTSLFWNIESISISQLLHSLFSEDATARELRKNPEYSILLQIRLPRVLLALLAGASLALAGALFQTLLRNVLADPYILGIASGATVGAYLTIYSGLSALFFFALPLGAFIGSVAVALLVFNLSRSKFVSDHNALLLSGVMVGTFLSAFTLLILSSERSTYQNAIKWLLGSLSNATLESVAIASPIVALCIILLFSKARALNIMSLGSQSAQLLGLAPRRFSIQIYVIACMLTAIIVCFTGSIGFVGLVIPHVCRLLFGSDNRILLPSVFLVGAIFMLIADFIARTSFYPIELPVGAVTAILGAPVFIYLLRKS